MKLQSNKNQNPNNYQNLSKVNHESEMPQKSIYDESKDKSPESKSGDSIPDNIYDTTGYVTNLVKNMFNKIITDEGTLSFLNENPSYSSKSKDKKNSNRIDDSLFFKKPVFNNKDIISNNKVNCDDTTEFNLTKTSSVNSNLSIDTIYKANLYNNSNKDNDKSKNANNYLTVSRQNSEESIQAVSNNVNNNFISIDNKNHNNNNNNNNKNPNKNSNSNNNQLSTQIITNNNHHNTNNKNNNNKSKNNFNSNYNKNSNHNKDKESNSTSSVNSDKVIIKGKNFNNPPVNQSNLNKSNYFDRFNSNSYNNNNGFKEVCSKKNKNENANKNPKINNHPDISKNHSLNNAIYDNTDSSIKKIIKTNNPLSNFGNYSNTLISDKENSIVVKNKSNNKNNNNNLTNLLINKNNHDSFTITNDRKLDVNKNEIFYNEKEIHHSKTKSFNNETEVKIEKSINHEIIQKKTLMVDNSSQTDLKKLLSEKSNEKVANDSKTNSSSTSLSIIKDEPNKSKIKEFECQTNFVIENEDEVKIEDIFHTNIKMNKQGNDLNDQADFRNNKKTQSNNLNCNKDNKSIKNKKNTPSAVKVVGMYANDSNNNSKSTNKQAILSNNVKTQAYVPGNNNNNSSSISKNTLISNQVSNLNLKASENNSSIKSTNLDLNKNTKSQNNDSNALINIICDYGNSSNQKNLVCSFPSGNSNFTSRESTNNKNNAANNTQPSVIQVVPQSLNDILNSSGQSKNQGDKISCSEGKCGELNNSYPNRIETFSNNNNKNTNFRKNSFYNNNNNRINTSNANEDEDYFEQEFYRDSHFNSFHKNKSFKGAYIPYSKRAKNGFYNPNKFNNGLDSNMMINKKFNNNTPYYQRGSPYEYNNYNYNFNYGNINNNEQEEYNGHKKDPQIFNNYFIINSNININGVGNNALNNISGNIIHNNSAASNNSNQNIMSSNNGNTMSCNDNININGVNATRKEVLETDKNDLAYSINNSSCNSNSENILNINMRNLTNMCYNPSSNIINNNNLNNIYNNNTKEDSFNSPSRAVNTGYNPGLNFYPQYFNGMGFVYNMFNFGMSDYGNPHAQMPLLPNYIYPQVNNPGIIAKNLNFENNENKKINENQDNKNSLSLSKIYEDIHPFIFHYKLHNDILDYSNSVNEIVEFMKEIKKYIIRNLESSMRKCLGNN